MHEAPSSSDPNNDNRNHISISLAGENSKRKMKKDEKRREEKREYHERVPGHSRKESVEQIGGAEFIHHPIVAI